MSEALPELTRRVCGLVAEAATLDPMEVRPGAHFYDELGLDSLEKLDIIVNTERTFGVKFTDEEAAEVENIEDLISLLSGGKQVRDG